MNITPIRELERRFAVKAAITPLHTYESVSRADRGQRPVRLRLNKTVNLTELGARGDILCSTGA
ncbi:MAG: hypothetical protein ACYSWQ_08435 [Planctomycetota bacterium]